MWPTAMQRRIAQRHQTVHVRATTIAFSEAEADPVLLGHQHTHNEIRQDDGLRGAIGQSY